MKKTKSAFSLIELSIVLVIISVIIAGTLSVSTVSINNAKTKTTNDRIAAIYKAIGNFVLTNYRLPCPAPLNIARDTSGYGVSNGSPGSCSSIGKAVYKSSAQSSIVYGALPCVTLNLPIDLCEDGFGNKFSYIVSEYFTAADYPNISGNNFSFHADDDSSTIFALQAASNNYIGRNIFVIISHGLNKYGAFDSKLTIQNNASSDIYERANHIANLNNSNLTANFGYLDVPQSVIFAYNNSKSDVFDDIVFVKTRDDLVMDFNAMFLIPCLGDASYPNAYYDQIAYRNTSCSNPSGLKPNKRCVAFGKWAEEQWCKS